MLNSEPLEIIAAPFTLYLAPANTAAPAIDAAPAAPWVKVGTSGDLNYTADGVRVSHAQNINFFRALGDLGSRKAFRTSEDLKIAMSLADMTLEQYKLAINGNAVGTTAQAPGVAGKKKIGLSRGTSLTTYALLVRGPSPYMTDGTAQYWVPIVVQTGTPEAVLRADDAAVLALEFTALVDADAADTSERFGYLEAQTTVAGV